MSATSAGTQWLALDAMGGDHGPEAMLEGARLAAKADAGLRFLVFGPEAQINALVDADQALAQVCAVRDAPEVVQAEDKPAVALRSKRHSSMRLAIEAVRDGEAAACVSCGNTGALMALSKIIYKGLPQIDRPAIASFFPNEGGSSVMLDLGANVECEPHNLVEFAIMGAVYDRVVNGRRSPRIGLLNIGSEAMKGSDIVRRGADALAQTELPGTFAGFVEGDDIPRGAVDVVVTDGFTGNVALKTAEGTARLIRGFVRESFRSSLLAKLGALLARGGLNQLRMRLDPRRYNGAMFLGLQQITVKSHGGSDGLGNANAIRVAANMARNDVVGRIRAELASHGRGAGLGPTAQTA